MGDVVGGDAHLVSDGEVPRTVYDRHVIRDHKVVSIRTRRGLKLCGSNNHRILGSDRSRWIRLDELRVGDGVAVSGGADLWPQGGVTLNWQPDPRTRLIVESDPETEVVHSTRQNLALQPAQQTLRYSQLAYGRRKAIKIPDRVSSALAQFAGYLVGDGHISRVKRQVGLTTGDEEQARAFATLGFDLFGLLCTMKLDGGRWRVLLHSETLSDFLVEALGFTTGPSARRKTVPEGILRSPKHIVAAFLRAYFDCDGYAGAE